jgi:hypothetical protein
MIKNNNNNTPYVRKKISSTLVTLSAAIALLLGSLLLPLSNFIQPVQAQNSMTFKATPDRGNYHCANVQATLTFDAQGTASSDFQSANITSGLFQIIYSATGDTAYSGRINSGTYTNDNSGGTLDMYGVVDDADGLFPSCASQGSNLKIHTPCSGSNDSGVGVFNEDNGGSILGIFYSPVECSQGGGNTASSMTGTTTQDRDRGSSGDSDGDGDGDSDGIPDSSDNCPHNSHHRCFKEGDTSTTTPQQESSSSLGGNQTRQ